MKARMDEEEILSMMRALLEAQQRGLASQTTNHDGPSAHEYQSAYDAGSPSWEPTGRDSFEGSSGYQGGNYAPEDHRGTGEGLSAWEPTGEHGFDRSYTYQESPYAQEHISGYDAGYHSWEPPSNQGFHSSSTYHEGPLDGYYAPAHQSEYDAGYHSWEPPCHNGVDGSSVYQGDPYAQAYRSEYGAGYDTWEPPCNNGVEDSSDFEGVPYAQEHHYGYEGGSQSWDMQYANGDNNCSSPISINEDTYNMMKMLLEAQTKTNELINSFAFRIPSTTPSAAATAHVESFNNYLTTWHEEDDSDCLSIPGTGPQEVPPTDKGDSFAAIDPHQDEFQQEADWANIECDFLLGSGGDEHLELRHDDPDAPEVPFSSSTLENVVCEDACQGGFVVECLGNDSADSPVLNALSTWDVIPLHTIPNFKIMASPLADASKEDQGNRSPLPPPFAKPLASKPPTAAPIGLPWNLPYEEIRMKEFGGWFYDEYDPGDPQFRRVHLDKSQA